MRNINLKRSLFVILGIALALYFIFLKFIIKESITVLTLIKVLPKVVTLEVLVIGLFSAYLWKWRIFKGWLVPFPNLSGTWKGTIQTTWVDPLTNNRPAPIPVILTIKQSFFKVSCVMRTKEMTSRTITSDFVLDKDNQLKRLFYSYESNPQPTVKDRSPQHCGTIYFDIIEEPSKQLIGEYWTGRKTTGNVKLDFWKSNLIEIYPNDMGEHPVSLTRNNKC
jgi:hypothetical protein